MSIKKRFSAWVNKPLVMPSWFGYLMMAILASWLTAFMMTNIFKSVGIASQMIEMRGLVRDVEQNIEVLNVRVAKIDKPCKSWWKSCS